MIGVKYVYVVVTIPPVVVTTTDCGPVPVVAAGVIAVIVVLSGLTKISVAVVPSIVPVHRR